VNALVSDSEPIEMPLGEYVLNRIKAHDLLVWIPPAEVNDGAQSGYLAEANNAAEHVEAFISAWRNRHKMSGS